jgi:hypothetical protein
MMIVVTPSFVVELAYARRLASIWRMRSRVT